MLGFFLLKVLYHRKLTQHHVRRRPHNPLVTHNRHSNGLGNDWLLKRGYVTAING